MERQAVRSDYLERLLKDASMMGLPFLISQLCKVGYSAEDIEFESVQTDYSHKRLIQSAVLLEDHIHVKLNLGWHGSQSNFKSIFDALGTEETEEQSELVNAGLKLFLQLLHPELESTYQGLFQGVKNDQAINPASLSQLYRQFSSALSSYHFSLSVSHSEEGENNEVVRLGEAYIGGLDHFVLGEFGPVANYINVTLHVDEDLNQSEIDEIYDWIVRRWVSKYGLYWAGYTINFFQKILDPEESFYLPGSLGSEKMLQAGSMQRAKITLNERLYKST